MSSREAGRQGIPGWAFTVAVVVVAAIAAFALFRMYSSGGPRDPSTYPKEAYQAPGYSKMQKPANTQTGAPPPSAGNPYAGYGQGGGKR